MSSEDVSVDPAALERSGAAEFLHPWPGCKNPKRPDDPPAGVASSAGCANFRLRKGGIGSTSNCRRSVLLGYGTMASNQLPHAILPDESIGTENSLDAMFSADHPIISVGVGCDRGVAVVDANF